MSYSVTITDKADEDLRSIFEYIAFDLHSRINAARQINRLEEAINSLSEMPKRFSLYGNEPWRSRGLRMMPVDNYCVLYIACDDTLTNPHHSEKGPFELIVSNPPYSIKWAGDSNPLLINDPRFSPAGVLAPKSKADLAFIMHSLAYLAPNGTAAIVCFPGIMYRGGAEQKIRKYLVDNNFVDCIIQLPSNLFFGTSIATCVMVMKRGKSDNNILFIDASNECVKVTNNNKLSPVNIENIVNAFSQRKDKEYFCKLVSYEEIKEQGYNLSVSTYVEQEDKREKIDIDKLNSEIREIVAREQALRDDIDKIIAEIAG